MWCAMGVLSCAPRALGYIFLSLDLGDFCSTSITIGVLATCEQITAIRDRSVIDSAP
jgi:hypothetical protein